MPEFFSEMELKLAKPGISGPLIRQAAGCPQPEHPSPGSSAERGALQVGPVDSLQFTLMDLLITHIKTQAFLRKQKRKGKGFVTFQ